MCWFEFTFVEFIKREGGVERKKDESRDRARTEASTGVLKANGFARHRVHSHLGSSSIAVTGTGCTKISDYNKSEFTFLLTQHSEQHIIVLSVK